MALSLNGSCCLQRCVCVCVHVSMWGVKEGRISLCTRRGHWMAAFHGQQTHWLRVRADLRLHWNSGAEFSRLSCVCGVCVCGIELYSVNREWQKVRDVCSLHSLDQFRREMCEGFCIGTGGGMFLNRIYVVEKQKCNRGKEYMLQEPQAQYKTLACGNQTQNVFFFVFFKKENEVESVMMILQTCHDLTWSLGFLYNLWNLKMEDVCDTSHAIQPLITSHWCCLFERCSIRTCI